MQRCSRMFSQWPRLNPPQPGSQACGAKISHSQPSQSTLPRFHIEISGLCQDIGDIDDIGDIGQQKQSHFRSLPLIRWSRSSRSCYLHFPATSKLRIVGKCNGSLECRMSRHFLRTLRKSMRLKPSLATQRMCSMRTSFYVTSPMAGTQKQAKLANTVLLILKIPK